MKWEGVSPANLSQSLGGSNSQQSGSLHSSTGKSIPSFKKKKPKNDWQIFSFKFICKIDEKG